MPELHLTPRDVATLAAWHITTENPHPDWRESYIQQRIVSHTLEERLSEMKAVLKAEASITWRWKLAAIAQAVVIVGWVAGFAVGRWWR